MNFILAIRTLCDCEISRQRYSRFIIYKPIKDNCNSFSAILNTTLKWQIKLDLRNANVFKP